MVLANAGADQDITATVNGAANTSIKAVGGGAGGLDRRIRFDILTTSVIPVAELKIYAPAT